MATEGTTSRRKLWARRTEPPPISSATETENTDDDVTEIEDVNASPGDNLVRRRHELGPVPLRGSRSYGHVAPQLENERPLSERLSTLKVRSIWGAILLSLFIVLMAAGLLYVSIFVLALTTLLYREIIALKRNEQKDQKLYLFFFLRWYWFILTIYGTGYSYLIPLADGLQLPRSLFLEVLVSHHLIITYSLAFLGLVLFVLSLRRFSLRYQFSQFALMLLTCLFAVGQSLFQIANLSDGLIWFFMSTTTVMVNDVFAYLFGIFLGRTRLIKLSPKKTLEGFLGSSVVTLLWSVLVGSLLSQFQAFVCPQRQVIVKPFTVWSQLQCEPMPIFRLQEFKCPKWFLLLTGLERVFLRPAVFHFLVLGVFAAFFAPFGGFFASALKRAARTKDFGDSIPGHGGITDRFDCQILMGMFTFLYVRTFVHVRRPSIDYIINLVSQLTRDERGTLLSLLQALPSP